jgi:formiminotetrahydrofolate cyclodeaminase
MEHDAKLEDRTISAYLDAIASDAPAPGGGSVAGVVGGFAAALAEMVANLTKDPSPELIAARDQLTALRASTVAFGAADELLYPAYIASTKKPKNTDDEKQLRKTAMQEAIMEAAATPMQLAEAAVNVLEALKPVIDHGNKNVLSDAEVSIILAEACIAASMVNVRVNVRMIRDDDSASNISSRAKALQEKSDQLIATLRERLSARAS